MYKNHKNTVSVKTMEDGTYERPRHYTVRKKLYKIIPLTGIDSTKNRTIIQPSSTKK